MTSPWPKPDYETKTVMCALCFDVKKFEELSRNAAGELTDVCLVCREKEIRAILKQVEMILAVDTRAIQGPQFRSEVTQQITFEVARCGHVVDCLCKSCHQCGGFCVYAR